MDGEPGEGERLFHLRQAAMIRVRRLVVRRLRSAAVRVALCPHPNVAKAPCVSHPISVDDAIVFSCLGPRIRGLEADARRAVGGLDQMGQPTAALASLRGAHGQRAIVWRTSLGVKRGSTYGAAVSLAVKLLEQHGHGRWWKPVGLGAVQESMPPFHYSEWSRPHAVILGALAWRAARAHGLRVTPTRPECGDRFFVDPRVVGRSFADLTDPFEPLLRLGSLGVDVVASSTEAILLELRA